MSKEHQLQKRSASAGRQTHRSSLRFVDIHRHNSKPCRRARHGKGYKVLNVFFLVDTGSPVSYLSKEAMEALVARPNSNLPQQLKAVVQNESCNDMAFYLSPMGTEAQPGKFHDVNVLGIDFLLINGLSLIVDAPVGLFRLVKKEKQSIYADYPDEDSE